MIATPSLGYHGSVDENARTDHTRSAFATAVRSLRRIGIAVLCALPGFALIFLAHTALMRGEIGVDFLGAMFAFGLPIRYLIE